VFDEGEGTECSGNSPSIAPIAMLDAFQNPTGRAAVAKAKAYAAELNNCRKAMDAVTKICCVSCRSSGQRGARPWLGLN